MRGNNYSEREPLLLSRVLKCTSCRRTQNKTDMILLTFPIHVMHIVVSHDILCLYPGKVKVQNRFNEKEYAWSRSTSGKQIIAPSHHHFLHLKYGLYGKLKQLKRTTIQVPIKIDNIIQCSSFAPKMSSSSATYFSESNKKGEVSELKKCLQSPEVQRDAVQYKKIIQKVIECMTLGMDLSSLFMDMIKV